MQAKREDSISLHSRLSGVRGGRNLADPSIFLESAIILSVPFATGLTYGVIVSKVKKSFPFAARPRLGIFFGFDVAAFDLGIFPHVFGAINFLSNLNLFTQGLTIMGARGSSLTAISLLIAI